MSKNTTVKTTNDYTIFEVDSSNRGLSIPHVNKLRRSMYQHGFLKSFPISCVKGSNGKLIVTDGQHRLQAAILLGLEIAYVIEEVSVDPSVIPSQKRWDLTDYLARHATAGKQTYVEILRVAQYYGVSNRTAAGLLMNDISNNRNNEFKSGNAEIVAFEEAISALSTARECCRRNSNLLINPLAMALFRVHVVTSVKYSDALTRIEAHADQMLRFNSVDRGYDELEKAYNFRMKVEQRIPLAMLIKQQLILNKRTFGKGGAA